MVSEQEVHEWAVEPLFVTVIVQFAPQTPLSQIIPVPQLRPFPMLDHEMVLAPGWQLWQALPGFTVPDA
jgi:hypothetical protein